MKPFCIPKGRAAGTPLAQARSEDIQYWLERKSRALQENPRHRFAREDHDWIEAAEAELYQRELSTSPPPPPPEKGRQTEQTAMELVGTFSDSAQAAQKLLEAAEKSHLVAPAMVVGRLPEGCEIAFSVIYIDPYGSEVYKVGEGRTEEEDRVGIDKRALDRIAQALGATWAWSRRTDDGRHPHYCAWEAMGVFPGFDLTHRYVPGNVEIDAREEGGFRGAAAEEIRRAAELRRKLRQDNDNGDAQLLHLRKFILRHAESKAMTRALANSGVRRSYARHELHKPFTVARLYFSGFCEDPVARADFRQAIKSHFLGATNVLYPSGTTHSAPALRPAPPLRPPVETSGLELDDDRPVPF